MSQQPYVHIRLRRDTSSNWTLNNPILKSGEPGLETDTRKLKFGDGVTPWNNLSYSGIDLGDEVVLENIDDRVASLIKAGSNISITYNDSDNELIVSATGLQLSGDYATLVNGKIPASQLPSYVDDVLEFNNLASFPSSGEGDKIYVAKDSNKTYRWSGSAYVEISASPGSTDSVPEGSVNKYYTDARASAAAPVQSVAGKTGTVTLVKSDVGLGNVDNTSDANKPVSTAQAAADTAVQNAAAADATIKANAAQAFAVQRSNHTGTQAITTISGLQSALDGKSSTSHTHDDRYYTESEVDNLLATKQSSGTYATLVNGTVPASQLPSYVDDVIEAANFSALPATGESGKIYVTLDSNKTYRWSGSAYVEISASPGSTDAVPEGSVNKYYTDARASAAAPVQSVSGRTGAITLTKSDVGLGNVDNTSDLNKPISTATQSELNLKLNASEVETDLVAGSGVSLSYDNTNNSLTISASVQSVAGRTGAVTLTKNDVGLGNVDNTSDLNKPVSTATQTALDGKAAASHTHDDRYYTESEVDTLLSGKAASSHTHDDRYYTETEIDTLLAGKLNTSITNLSGSRTVYVDGNRTDTYTADGTIFRPFKTIQAAHDYAVTVTNGPPSTAWYTGQVVIRINAGRYIENLTVTRSNIHFVGAGGAKTRDVIINGRVTLNINENPFGLRDSNLVSFSNLIVWGSTNTTSTLFVAGGTASYLLFFAHMHLSNLSGFEGGASCKTFEVTNTSAEGIKIEVREMLLGQDNSSLVAMDLNNVSVADIDQLSATSLGTLMELKTTFASISNSKLETTGASGAVAVIRAISSFAGAPATLVLGNSLLVNGNTNGDGIYIGAGAVANVGQVAFNIGTALGTGFAVNGVTGATLISASNTFGVLPVSPFLTNNKVATAITNASLGTSLTRNNVPLDTRTPAAHTHDDRYYTETEVNTLLAGKQNSGTYATLVGGLVPASQLPSYVDDVLEFANLAAFPVTGETGKIYVALNNNKTYRWSGSAYVEISASPGSTDAVPEGSVNLYYTNARASAAAPVQSVAGRIGTVTLAKADVGLGNVDNTSDANKPISTATQAALDGKQAAGNYAAAVHGHAVADVTGLQTALDGKAALSHAHSASDITSGTVAVARLGSGTPSASTYLRGDGTWDDVAYLRDPATGGLLPSNAFLTSPNVVGGTQAVVVGGEANTASGDQSYAFGYGAVAHNPGQMSHSANPFVSPGDAQAVRIIGRASTTSATARSITDIGSTSASSRLPKLRTNTAMFLTVTIGAIMTNGSKGAHYVRKVAIKNVSDTVSLIGTVSTVGTDVEDDAAYDVSITADNTNKCLNISVTGKTGESLRWFALCDGVEIGWYT